MPLVRLATAGLVAVALLATAGASLAVSVEYDDTATALAVQPDGAIVAAGWSSPGYYEPSNFALARYLPDGRRDPAFGTDGKVLTDFDSRSDWAVAVALARDGGIVAAGDTAPIGSAAQFALARYLPDGRLDGSFGTGGKVVTGFGARYEPATAHAMAVQADGRIVVAGGASGDFALARYLPDGRLDAGFGDNGRVLTDLGADAEWISAIAADSAGRIVAVGVSSPLMGPGDLALVRYEPDGRLDPSFGDGGRVLTDLSGNDDAAQAMAIQDDGRIVVAGSTEPPAADLANAIALVRYQPDGGLDSSFGAGGTVVTKLSPDSDDVAYGMTIAPGGSIVVAGASDTFDESSGIVLLRFTPDGVLDSSFGERGTVRTSFDAGTPFASALTLATGGSLVAAGGSSDSDSSDFALARFSPDGRADPSFGVAGKVLTDFGPVATRIASLTATTAAKGVLVSWWTASELETRGFVVLRLTKGKRVRVNSRLIAGKGSLLGGASYSLADRRAAKTTKRYWLQEVKRNGTRVLYGPVRVRR
jgi:uncharacterized delta-60 repeat protein